MLGMSVVLAGSVNAQAVSIFEPYFTFTDNNSVALTAQSDGFYSLIGVMNGSYSVSGTYQDMYNYNVQQSQLPNPVYVNEPYAPSPNQDSELEFSNQSFSTVPAYAGGSIWMDARAANSSNGGGWYYGPNGLESVNGSVKSNSSGTLFANITWNQPLVNDPTFAQAYPGYVPPPPPAAPDHVMVLLKNTDAVSISLQNDANGQPIAGLSGEGSVTDSLGGTVSASAPGSGPSSASKVTYHLIRVNLGSKNTGKVSFGGSANASVVNSAPFQALSNGYPVGNGVYAEANTGASIAPEFRLDSREIFLTRPGAVGEWRDSNGVTHGDTVFSRNDKVFFTDPMRLGYQSVPWLNTQNFEAVFSSGWPTITGSSYYGAFGTQAPNIVNWKWTPNSPVDTWDHGAVPVPFGTEYEQTDAAGVMTLLGPVDTSVPYSVSYTATDKTDGAQGTASYVVTIHDPFDNVREVDKFGNPASSGGLADSAGSVIEGQASGDMPQDSISVIETVDTDVDWTDGEIGVAGVTGGSAIVLTLFPDPPVQAIAALNLVGLGIQSMLALPPPKLKIINAPIGSPTAMFQQAYENYVYNKTCAPGEQVTDNLVDGATGAWLDGQPNLTWDLYINTLNNTVSVTATVNKQLINRYFYSDEWGPSGLITHTAPGTVRLTGALFYTYLWHRS